MLGFKEITKTNGFDFTNPINARQNNYAWSMSDLGDYIYVGTGRNIISNILYLIEPAIRLPAMVNPGPMDNLGEIWRYKKDGTLPWTRVYKAQTGSGIAGFRYMVRHSPFSGSPCLYAAAIGAKVKVLKSTNGVNWYEVPDTVLQGASSRAMVSHRGKLYIATLDEMNQGGLSYLYSSEDPEFYPWEPVIDYNDPDYNPYRNPSGPISNMAVFNNKIYVAVSSENGVEIWRTNKDEPRLNDWTLVSNNGFGDPANKYSLSMGVFGNYLYVSGTKQLPLSWAIPRGCDVARIDKYDNLQLVVGGSSIIPGHKKKCSDNKSLSGLKSGFNNPFNVYAWQIQEYQGRLLISTFDDSINMEVILYTLLANRQALERLIGDTAVKVLILIYKTIVKLLRSIRYPFGFDLYSSGDGVNFYPVFLDGLNNPYNYGGRILYVDRCNDLYVGTANPFQGCEVWKATDEVLYDLETCHENHYKNLWEVRNIIEENYSTLEENLQAISKILPRGYYLG
ncbi:MAG: hypothetical protein GX754_03860 [Clostridiaceae bacterium]|nr:hypothetical protein [Clostridiaceae bacterium]